MDKFPVHFFVQVKNSLQENTFKKAECLINTKNKLEGRLVGWLVGWIFMAYQPL